MGAPLHNFGFTSEVRYWFPFDATKTYRLEFLGDDDVWVFVNRRLAVDLGGIHTASAEAGATHDRSGRVSATNNYGMTTGNVYEIVVFQAERQKTSSTYQLTLSGFNGAVTECKPICGDKVVTAPEQCDNGTAANSGGYNKCNADCTLGPFCGDGDLDAPDEQCDNRTNNDAYGAKTGCGPGCKLPARCGDGVVQTLYGEQCDDGVNDGHYTGCTATCQRAGYCGDGKVQSPNEACDDGANDSSYGTCGDPAMPLPNCGLAPRCGDGVVQDLYGEACEPKSSNDPECTPNCRRPGVCGDGVEDRQRGVRLRRGRQHRRLRRMRAGVQAGAPLRRRHQGRARGVRRRRPRQQLRRLFTPVQARPSLRRRYGRADLRAVRLGPENGTQTACSVVCKFNIQ